MSLSPPGEVRSVVGRTDCGDASRLSPRPDTNRVASRAECRVDRRAASPPAWPVQACSSSVSRTTSRGCIHAPAVVAADDRIRSRARSNPAIARRHLDGVGPAHGASASRGKGSRRSRPPHDPIRLRPRDPVAIGWPRAEQLRLAAASRGCGSTSSGSRSWRSSSTWIAGLVGGLLVGW